MRIRKQLMWALEAAGEDVSGNENVGNSMLIDLTPLGSGTIKLANGTTVAKKKIAAPVIHEYFLKIH